MTYTEIKGDLFQHFIKQGNMFLLPSDRNIAYAHCIANDGKYGAGIAPVFINYFFQSGTFVKRLLKENPWDGHGWSLAINRINGKHYLLEAELITKEFTYENAHEEIPLFWSEVFSKYANNINVGKEPQSECEKAIVDYCIGEYAVCVDDLGKDKFRYLVAGKYTGGEVPQEYHGWHRDRRILQYWCAGTCIFHRFPEYRSHGTADRPLHIRSRGRKQRRREICAGSRRKRRLLRSGGKRI